MRWEGGPTLIQQACNTLRKSFGRQIHRKRNTYPYRKVPIPRHIGAYHTSMVAGFGAAGPLSRALSIDYRSGSRAIMFVRKAASLSSAEHIVWAPPTQPVIAHRALSFGTVSNVPLTLRQRGGRGTVLMPAGTRSVVGCLRHNALPGWRCLFTAVALSGAFDLVRTVDGMAHSK
jgi:hypothetical protein